MLEPQSTTTLAVAMLRRIEAELRLPYTASEVVGRPLFAGSTLMLGAHALDSLDLLEAMEALDAELGVLVIDRDELRAAGTLEGIAKLVLARADSGAVERFCEHWAMVGIYQP
jgi:hypothetical protein